MEKKKKYRSRLHAYVDYRSGLLNKTQKQVAVDAGMSQGTLRSRLFAPDTISIGEFRVLMDTLKASEFEREQVMKDLMKGVKRCAGKSYESWQAESP